MKYKQLIMSLTIDGDVSFQGSVMIGRQPSEVILAPIPQDRFLAEEDGTLLYLQDGEKISLEDNT